jgi:low affinity Fe/Cu permease|tara:strand:- start:1396 stop:1836 length:441 start_codon:yes stop_codon:yes gene_type:complete
MTLPKNGVARELRSYIGSLFIFVFIIGIIITFVQYPVLESNKEIVLMLIGSIAASIPILISAISGTRPDDVNALKADVQKRDHTIEMLIESKDNLEAMIINLQKEILSNQDNMMDKIILKAAMEFDDKHNPPCACKGKNCNCGKDA